MRSKAFRLIAGTTAGTAACMALLVAPASAAPDVTTKADHSYSVTCKGGKANLSWSTGSLNTRVYYNNHCSTTAKVSVQLADAENTWLECLSMPAGKKSSKEFNHGLTGSIQKMIKGC